MDSDAYWLTWSGLLLWCAGYAWILSRPRVQEWHVPDWTPLTVVLGFVWVDMGMAVLAWRGLIPWPAVGMLAGLEVAAGLPILVWQGRQTWERRRRRLKRNGNGGAHVG